MDEPTSGTDDLIDLNDVTREQLEGRCGLTPEVSNAIVAFRAEHGPWTSIEQLLEIPGIDASVLGALRQCVFVAPPGEAAMPATDDIAPVQDESLIEQAGPSKPEPDFVPVVRGLVPAESSGDEAYFDEELVAEPEAADAFTADMLSLESALESGDPENERLQASSMVSEPVNGATIEESPAEPDYGELEPPSTASEALPTMRTTERDLDQPTSASEELVDGEQVSSLDVTSIAPETPSERVDSDQELLVTSLLSEPGHVEPESTRAEELSEEVAADAAELWIPEQVEEEKGFPLVTDSAAATAATAMAPAPVRRRSVWHDIGMIALGGLVGALLTLLVLGGVGGTLTYAPRRLVDALSQNMSIMQDNQETTWSQLQSLSSRADALEKKLGALETLEGRVVELESGSAAMDAQLGDLSGGVDRLSATLAALESQHAVLIQGLDTRLGSQERDLDALGETVSGLRESVQEMRETVDKFESFFDALRELLIDMKGDAVVESGA